MTTVEYLRLDLTRCPALANAAQVGRSVSANSGDAMATLATLGAKSDRPALTRICVRRVHARMIGEGED
jgi:hypothetical protein